MPITQRRMLAVVEEAESVQRWAETLRGDLRGLLAGDMDAEARLEALRALVEISPVPACIHCAVERDHFRRTARRNDRNAQRMRTKRLRSVMEEDWDNERTEQMAESAGTDS